MSRYRPPAPPKSPYITPEGEKVMRDEFHQLWKIERPEVTQQVSDAAKLGDRSENAEYIYGKKRLREIDSRVRYLTKRLEILKVVTQLPTDQTKIYFGAWITLEDQDEKVAKYRIVGPDEIDAQGKYISIDAPLAKALMGKQEDDDVIIEVGGKRLEYLVLKVEYEQIAHPL